MKNKKIIVAITGASGSIYAQKLLFKLGELSNQFSECTIIFSENGKNVWNYELNESFSCADNKKFRIVENSDLFDATASGSALYSSMIIIPCSMGTLGKIASGLANDLISRAADVMLKEKRQLLIVPRESPYNKIHLKNMLELMDAGAEIIPASPYFYHHPQNIEELLNPFISRIIEKSGIEIDFDRWKKD